MAQSVLEGKITRFARAANVGALGTDVRGWRSS
jgi:hypothetical protein